MKILGYVISVLFKLCFFSQNWADAVENDDDEFSEPVQRNEEPGPREAVRAPADRHSDRNRRRRKKR